MSIQEIKRHAPVSLLSEDNLPGTVPQPSMSYYKQEVDNQRPMSEKERQEARSNPLKWLDVTSVEDALKQRRVYVRIGGL